MMKKGQNKPESTARKDQAHDKPGQKGHYLGIPGLPPDKNWNEGTQKSQKARQWTVFIVARKGPSDGAKADAYDAKNKSGRAHVAIAALVVALARFLTPKKENETGSSN